jgi:hypothetical protein
MYQSKSHEVHFYDFASEQECEKFCAIVKRDGGHSFAGKRSILVCTKMECSLCKQEVTPEEESRNPGWCLCDGADKGKNVICTERIEWRNYAKASKQTLPGCTCPQCVSLPIDN